MKIEIDYISNFSLTDSSGGWNGINYKLVDALSAKTRLNYIGPINPKIIIHEKIFSKLLRILGLPGDYFFFSRKRLENIVKEINSKKLSGKFTFYFGATPWINHKISTPYGLYIDICFPKYLKLYINDQRFKLKDIDRISEAEKFFLQNASIIFWGSNWAKIEAEECYKCSFPQSVVVSTGGHIPIPKQIKIHSNSQLRLLFISLNFFKKGGHIAFETFKLLKDKGYNVMLDIIGEKPPDHILNVIGVNYHGVLKKSSKIDLKKMQDLLDSSFLLIHPTKMDTMGAVIAEAGYYGLPTVAPNSFGIPDLIINNKTGLLVDELTPVEFSNRIEELILSPCAYSEMRRSVRNFMVTERSWNSISDIIVKNIQCQLIE